MGDLAADRVYDERTDDETVYIAGGIGVTAAAVSNGRIGRFQLAHRCVAEDVATTADGRPVVATADETLVGTDFAASGFGPAVTVGADGETALAADETGRLARFEDGWNTTGRVDAAVHGLDGDLVAASDGVHRADGTHIGLDDAYDVAATGPFVATERGIFRRVEGWRRDCEAPTHRVTSDGRQALAVTADGRVLTGSDGEWRALGLEAGSPFVDVACGESAYALTEDGRLFVGHSGDWRSRSLGLSAATALAVA
jgi:hypothetical protein